MSTSFSVEIRSKRHVKSISISDEAHERVLFEADLGELQECNLVEGDVLEFTGPNGILRINVTEEQLLQFLERKNESFNSSEVGSSRNTKNQRR